MTLFAGKAALVIGATSGIGREAAIQFGHSGAKVVLAGRRSREGEEAAEAVRAAGGEARFIEVDMAIEEQVASLIKQAVFHFGRLDCAFNNGAVEGDRPLLVEETVENCDRVMAVNVRGVLLSMKYEIAQMLKQGKGAIVNSASVAGWLACPMDRSIPQVNTRCWG